MLDQTRVAPIAINIKQGYLILEWARYIVKENRLRHP